MKTLYEGMFILPKSLNDDDLDGALGSVRAEIEKLGGEVKTTTRLGKRPFARPMKKQENGHYYVIDFDMEGTSLTPLHARFKLNPNVFRVQIVRNDERVVAEETTVAE